MKIRIIQIHNAGSEQDELVVMEVLEDCDVGKYLLSDSSYTTDGSLSNKIRHIYWFPDQEVKKGDFIWLYTRRSKATDEHTWRNDSKTTTYAFYWGLNIGVWNDEGDYAVLFDITKWSFKKVSEAS